VRLADLFRRKRRDDGAVLRARFARFRHLLEMNNRILALIADASEKLGGEYLFDTQYLRSFEKDLRESATAVIHDLAEISGNRYPRLAESLERVQSAVLGSLAPQRLAGDPSLTLSLDVLGTEWADVVGEKMARLGEIRHLPDIRVPDGFVVTIRACEQVLSTPAIASEIAHYRSGDNDAAAKLQSLILSAAVPAAVSRSIRDAASRFSRNARFAVRSSALGEDTNVSFAGQYETLLNVPRERIPDAWLKVVASLFSPSALEYRRQHGLAPPAADMAVGCLVMVPATVSGVIYTVDPNMPYSNMLLVSAVRGLSVPLVEGRDKVDEFKLSRAAPHQVAECEISEKVEMYKAARDEGIKMVPIPADERMTPSLGKDQLATLANVSLRIERHMKSAQDIEWALDHDGAVTVLQARPLRLGPEAQPRAADVLAARSRHRILMHGCGEVACRGIGAGAVFLARSDQMTEGFAPGNVLVTPFATPRLAVLVASASALVSEVGSVTGHLATVAREYRVPTIMGAKEATRLLTPGMTITVDAEDNTVYDGAVDELLRYQLLRSQPYEETREFRALRRMLKHAAPLRLGDPGTPGFAPEQCRTYHDIIRFAHERALVELARLEGIRLDGSATTARMLDLEIPLDLVVIDLGGGIAAGASGKHVVRSQITSTPLMIFLEGLLTPGVWCTSPADMDLEGFMASATRAGPLTMPGSRAVRRNVAIVASDYLNLNLTVGYHMNVVDCHLDENPENSYIFFRFVGGVTDVTRRTRRARLLAGILAAEGFKTDLSGELVIGRLQGVSRQFCEERLQMVGRLVGFSRQLDILLRDEGTLERLLQAFRHGRYELSVKDHEEEWLAHSNDSQERK
jgi:pyruvate, water dikinase